MDYHFLRKKFVLIFLIIILLSYSVVAECDELKSDVLIDYNITLDGNCTYYIKNVILAPGIVFDGKGATITYHPDLETDPNKTNEVSPLIRGLPRVFKNVNLIGREDIWLVLFEDSDGYDEPVDFINITSGNRGRVRPATWTNICNVKIDRFNPENAKLNFSKDCYYDLAEHQIDLNTSYFCNGATINPLQDNEFVFMILVEDPNVIISDCIMKNSVFLIHLSFSVFDFGYFMLKNNYFSNENFLVPNIQLSLEVFHPIIGQGVKRETWSSLVYIINNTFNSSDEKNFLVVITDVGYGNLSSNASVFIYGLI